MGVRVDEVTQDHFADTFDVDQDLIIPEPNDNKSVVAQTGISMKICRGRMMLASVDFDCQASFKTDKIRDVDSDRILTPKADARNLSSSQMSPQSAFGIGQRAAQLTREVAFLSFAHPCAPG